MAESDQESQDQRTKDIKQPEPMVDEALQGDERRWRERLTDKLGDISEKMEKIHIAEFVELVRKPRRIIAVNLLAGLARGIGFGIGITLFFLLVLYFLNFLGALNLPIIGDFIADLVRIVQGQLGGP